MMALCRLLRWIFTKLASTASRRGQKSLLDYMVVISGRVLENCTGLFASVDRW